MGYYTYVSGEIRIDPPLTWAEFKDSKYRADDGYVNVLLRTHEEQRDAEGGVLLVRWADAIVPVSEDSRKYYEIEAHVQEIANAYGTSHTFSGHLEGSGEEQGDVWRLYVRDGKVVRVVAKVVWPEDSQ